MLQEARALLHAGRVAEAARACEQYLQQQPRDANGIHLLAMIRTEAGEPQAGERLLVEALQVQTDSALLWNGLGRVRARLGRAAEAVAALRQAVRYAPAEPAYQNDFGVALAGVERHAEAAAAFRASLALAPGERVALGNLATALERLSDLPALAGLLQDGLARWPEDTRLALAAARLARRSGRPAEALERLQRIPVADSPPLARDIHFELGRLHDAVGDPGVAWSHFVRANALARTACVAPAAPGPSLADEAQRLHARVTRSWLRSWRRGDNAPPDDTGPVFLVGFPRSGTTLLDSLLDTDPSIRVLEERPTVQAMLNAAGELPGGFPDGFATLEAGDILALRRRYRQAVEAERGDPAGIVVDKSPLNSMYAGFIHRVFPRARFIMVLRHPYDVCISCFMHEFGNTQISASFFTLDATVRLYSQVMDLWQRYREELPLDAREVRYEDYVRDTAGVLDTLRAYLGLPAAQAPLEQRPRNRLRAGRPVPGYDQIGEPIHARAIDRWRRYRTQLRPALERLAPYAERLGYESDVE